MSSTRLLVLGVVRGFQPVHGYDVRRELLSWRVDQWANVAPGSIYNALKTLTKEKFLQVAGTGQVGGRPERTQYSLTTDGEKEYQALLRATWWRVLPPIDDLMPALCFMPSLSKEELIAALEHRISALEGAIKHLEFSRGDVKPPDTPEHVRELYDRMRAGFAADIPWARTLIDRLNHGVYKVGPGKESAAGRPAHGRRKSSA
ncbi:MAG TPA: helix-turn-helix transcriptional regulator [Polyangia bacterium]|nr:helix-turn-helix transcriptional regulator [Polyangia bacterium]